MCCPKCGYKWEQCVLCGRSNVKIEYHHIIPLVYRGIDEEQYLLSLCGYCHGIFHNYLRPVDLGDLIKAGQIAHRQRPISERKAEAEYRLKDIQDLVRVLEIEEKMHLEKTVESVQEESIQVELIQMESVQEEEKMPKSRPTKDVVVWTENGWAVIEPVKEFRLKSKPEPQPEPELDPQPEPQPEPELDPQPEPELKIIFSNIRDIHICIDCSTDFRTNWPQAERCSKCYNTWKKRTKWGQYHG
jgi:hypothetical protein